mgnify:CR=1 FL=1
MALFSMKFFAEEFKSLTKMEQLYPKDICAFFMAISIALLQSSSLPVRFRVQILISSRRRQLNV